MRSSSTELCEARCLPALSDPRSTLGAARTGTAGQGAHHQTSTFTLPPTSASKTAWDWWQISVHAYARRSPQHCCVLTCARVGTAAKDPILSGSVRHLEASSSSHWPLEFASPTARHWPTQAPRQKRDPRPYRAVPAAIGHCVGPNASAPMRRSQPADAFTWVGAPRAWEQAWRPRLGTSHPSPFKCTTQRAPNVPRSRLNAESRSEVLREGGRS